MQPVAKPIVTFVRRQRQRSQQKNVSLHIFFYPRLFIIFLSRKQKVYKLFM